MWTQEKKRAEWRKRAALWRKRHPEENKRLLREYHLKRKTEALLAYTPKGKKPKCQCCGESIIQFLSLDHINGGGTKHRKQVGSGSKFYAHLRREGWPKGYRVLCHNCNMASGNGGTCPHKLN